MKTYKIFDGTDWVIGTPIDGELCREIKQSGKLSEHYIEYTYKDEVVAAPAIPIVITSISAVDPKNITHDASFNTAISYTGVTLTVTGTLAIPDRTFSLPIMRNDGRIFMFEAKVESGVFTSLINFPTSGSFVYSDNECNLDLPPNTFSVNAIKFDIREKVTA